MALSVGAVMADIVDNFSRPSATVTLEQPEALLNRLRATEPKAEGENPDAESTEAEEKEEAPVYRSKGKIVGYRVQVYADNNVRVAKGEARRRHVPGMTTYVAYASPYWRLRVGDFRTQAEAEKAAADIRRAFPGYAREVRIVRDRINAR